MISNTDFWCQVTFISNESLSYSGVNGYSLYLFILIPGENVTCSSYFWFKIRLTSINIYFSDVKFKTAKFFFFCIAQTNKRE